jgi:hypothetical protein
MSAEQFNLDRETNIANSVDSTNKKWEIKLQRGTSLCFARPNPDREDAIIPKEIDGRWTKPSLLRDRIKQYVTKSWDIADAANVKAERKREVAKEYKSSGTKSKEGSVQA